MDSTIESTSQPHRDEEMDVDEELTNKFLSGEMSFAEYSSEWYRPEDEEDLEDIGRNGEETINSVQVVEKSLQKRRRRTRLSAALVGLMGEANIRFARGDLDMAERMCHEIIKQLPTAAEPYQTLAQIYEHDVDKSLQFSLLAAHLTRSDAEEWWRLAAICKQRDDKKQEMICYTQAIKSEPQNLDAHMKRLEFITTLEEMKYPVNTLNVTRVKCYHKIVTSLPSSEGETIMKYAKLAVTLYHNSEEIERACEVMSTAYKQCSSIFTIEDINIYLELLISLKQYHTCIDVFVSSIGVEIEAEIQTIKNASGEIEEHTNYLSCIIPSKMAIDLKSKLLVCFIHLGSLSLVETLLNDFLSNDVDKAGDLYMDIEEAFSSVGHYEMAIKLLEPLVRNTNFDLGAVWLKHAECLYKLGRVDDAIDSYYKVLRHVPQHPNARKKLFCILEKKGCIEDALNILQQDYKYVVSANLLYEQCQALKKYNKPLKYLENSTFFPILRLLLPDCERERSAYNLKETKLGALLVKVLSLNKQTLDAQKLLNFRSVHSSSHESDFASIAFFVLNTRAQQTTPQLTVGAVNEILDKIAKDEVGNKGPTLDEAFSYAITKLTPQEFKWFLRMILKDLKLGMSSHRILSCFHPDAPELYRNCSDLRKVCEDLEDGDTRPLELGVQLFFAVRPMLSERMDVTHIHLSPNKTYLVEDKFDGERFQMHMENNIFEYYSRKGFAYSKKYGKTFESGILTPDLKTCFSSNAHNFILDGEMMGWHKENQCFGSKGMSYDIKKITEHSSYRACYCVFDILYYNGQSLVGPPDKGGLPLHERLKILDTLFTDVPGVIQHSKRETVKDVSDVVNALNKAIDDQDEGIVLKDVHSYYIPAQRNAGWFKIKPEYTEGTMTDLDLVIIGAEEAENKRQGRAKSFYVACADVDSGDTPQRWVCVGHVSSGVSYQEKAHLCALLEQHWRATRSAPAPPCLLFSKKKPDFWILPEHSIVLQVRATELVRSAEYGASYALRFPRVERIRDDKAVADVMTLQHFNQLVSTRSPVVKLSTKRINSDSTNEPKERKVQRISKAPQVSDKFRTKLTDDVEVTSKALLGRKLCILSDDDDCKKADLVRIIQSHGGKHVENSGPDTWCCVAGTITVKIRNLIAMRSEDIITTTWLRSLPASETLCSLSPLDMLSIKHETRLNLCMEYDTFGDSYKEEIDENTLNKCFKKMDAELPIYLTTREMLKLDRQLFGENNPFSFLRGCSIHVVDNVLYATLARVYGAKGADTPQAATHVVVPNKTKTEDLEALNINSKAKIVTEDWLKQCFKDKARISETEYLL
nr:DNA ligase 4-like [Maniola hyperantus]